LEQVVYSVVTELLNWARVSLCVLVFVQALSNAVQCRTDHSIEHSRIASEAIELEESANSLRKEWTAESLRRSIAVSETAASAWLKINNVERSADSLREIAECYLSLGQIDEAIAALERASRLDRRSVSSAKQVKTLALHAIALLRLGRVEEAFVLSGRAINLSKDIKDADCFAWGYYSRGLVENENWDFREAIQTFGQARGYWESISDVDGQAKVLLELAYAHMTNDEFEVALANAEAALRLANTADNRQISALARNAVGVMNSKLGRKEEALRIFLESERQFPNGVNELEKGDMFNHLAKIYSDFDELGLAETYHLKALEIYRRERNLSAELALLPKLGMINFAKGDKETGLSFFKRGFDLARQLNSHFQIAVLNQDMGRLSLEDDPAKSLYHSEKALETFEKIGIRQQFPDLQNRIGIIYLRRCELQ
jgi:tetratricopeptide (TPR) repeat protein